MSSPSRTWITENTQSSVENLMVFKKSNGQKTTKIQDLIKGTFFFLYSIFNCALHWTNYMSALKDSLPQQVLRDRRKQCPEKPVKIMQVIPDDNLHIHTEKLLPSCSHYNLKDACNYNLLSKPENGALLDSKPCSSYQYCLILTLLLTNMHNHEKNQDCEGVLNTNRTNP